MLLFRSDAVLPVVVDSSGEAVDVCLWSHRIAVLLPRCVCIVDPVTLERTRLFDVVGGVCLCCGSGDSLVLFTADHCLWRFTRADGVLLCARPETTIHRLAFDIESDSLWAWSEESRVPDLSFDFALQAFVDPSLLYTDKRLSRFEALRAVCSMGWRFMGFDQDLLAVFERKRVIFRLDLNSLHSELENIYASHICLLSNRWNNLLDSIESFSFDSDVDFMPMCSMPLDPAAGERISGDIDTMARLLRSCIGLLSSVHYHSETHPQAYWDRVKQFNAEEALLDSSHLKTLSLLELGVWMEYRAFAEISDFDWFSSEMDGGSSFSLTRFQLWTQIFAEAMVSFVEAQSSLTWFSDAVSKNAFDILGILAILPDVDLEKRESILVIVREIHKLQYLHDKLADFVEHCRGSSLFFDQMCLLSLRLLQSALAALLDKYALPSCDQLEDQFERLTFYMLRLIDHFDMAPDSYVKQALQTVWDEQENEFLNLMYRFCA